MSCASFRYKVANCTVIRGKVVSYDFRYSFLKCASLRKEAKKRASFRKERRYEQANLCGIMCVKFVKDKLQLYENNLTIATNCCIPILIVSCMK